MNGVQSDSGRSTSTDQKMDMSLDDIIQKNRSKQGRRGGRRGGRGARNTITQGTKNTGTLIVNRNTASRGRASINRRRRVDSMRGIEYTGNSANNGNINSNSSNKNKNNNNNNNNVVASSATSYKGIGRMRRGGIRGRRGNGKTTLNRSINVQNPANTRKAFTISSDSLRRRASDSLRRSTWRIQQRNREMNIKKKIQDYNIRTEGALSSRKGTFQIQVQQSNRRGRTSIKQRLPPMRSRNSALNARTVSRQKKEEIVATRRGLAKPSPTTLSERFGITAQRGRRPVRRQKGQQQQQIKGGQFNTGERRVVVSM